MKIKNWLMAVLAAVALGSQVAQVVHASTVWGDFTVSPLDDLMGD